MTGGRRISLKNLTESNQRHSRSAFVYTPRLVCLIFLEFYNYNIRLCLKEVACHRFEDKLYENVYVLELFN